MESQDTAWMVILKDKFKLLFPYLRHFSLCDEIAGHRLNLYKVVPKDVALRMRVFEHYARTDDDLKETKVTDAFLDRLHTDYWTEEQWRDFLKDEVYFPLLPFVVGLSWTDIYEPLDELGPDWRTLGSDVPAEVAHLLILFCCRAEKETFRLRPTSFVSGRKKLNQVLEENVSAPTSHVADSHWIVADFSGRHIPVERFSTFLAQDAYVQGILKYNPIVTKGFQYVSFSGCCLQNGHALQLKDMFMCLWDMKEKRKCGKVIDPDSSLSSMIYALDLSDNEIMGYGPIFSYASDFKGDRFKDILHDTLMSVTRWVDVTDNPFVYRKEYQQFRERLCATSLPGHPECEYLIEKLIFIRKQDLHNRKDWVGFVGLKETDSYRYSDHIYKSHQDYYAFKEKLLFAKKQNTAAMDVESLASFFDAPTAGGPTS